MTPKPATGYSVDPERLTPLGIGCHMQRQRVNSALCFVFVINKDTAQNRGPLRQTAVLCKLQLKLSPDGCQHHGMTQVPCYVPDTWASLWTITPHPPNPPVCDLSLRAHAHSWPGTGSA